MIIPVVITVYADRSYTFITKTPPAAMLLKKAAGVEKGSGVPNRNKVGTSDRGAGRGDRQDQDARPERGEPRGGDQDHRGHRALDGHRDRRASRETDDGRRARQEVSQQREKIAAGEPTRSTTAVKTRRRTSTLRQVRRDASRSRCASASIPSTPTRWCAAPWCCRTALGKTVRVLVFASGEKVKEAEEAGADFVGGEELAKKIEERLAGLRRRGRHPRHDAGGRPARQGARPARPDAQPQDRHRDRRRRARRCTEIKAGKVEFRVDKTGIIHAPIGKVSFSAPQLEENARGADRGRAASAKPAAAKGKYVKSASHVLDDGPGHLARRGRGDDARGSLIGSGGLEMALDRARKEKLLDDYDQRPRQEPARLRARLPGHHGAAGRRRCAPGCARRAASYQVVKNTPRSARRRGHAARSRCPSTSRARPRWSTAARTRWRWPRSLTEFAKDVPASRVQGRRWSTARRSPAPTDQGDRRRCRAARS